MNAISEELFQNEEFVKTIIVLSPEEAAKEIAAKGGDVTVDELKAIGEEVNKLLAQKNGELSEDALDDVVGGALTRKQWAIAIGVAAAVPVVVVCGW